MRPRVWTRLSGTMGARTMHELVQAFHDRTLPPDEWTHEAHLIVCWFALQTRGREETIELLRHAISAYNEATGTPNTDTSGYHETLTRYYVGAVAHVDAAMVADLFEAPVCRREAPLDHWSREVLFSPAAVRDWVEPDLRELPWQSSEE